MSLRTPALLACGLLILLGVAGLLWGLRGAPAPAARSAALTGDAAAPAAPPPRPALRDDEDPDGETDEEADEDPLAGMHCPAHLTVETEDGDPFSGAVLFSNRRRWAEADPEGGVDWYDRHCGYTEHLQVLERDATVHEQTVPFEDAEEVTLVIYAPRRVWMRPVDGAGDPIDAVLRPGVAQPDGTWLLERRAPEATVRAFVVGETGGDVVVPLDGAHHDVVVPRDRSVALTLRCDQCVGYVTCSSAPWGRFPACAGDGGVLDCPCPPEGPGYLTLRTPDTFLDYRETHQPLGVVSADQDALTIDVRGELGAVRAEVDSDVRVGVYLHRPSDDPDVEPTHFSALISVGDDGEIVAEDLLPGDWELTVVRSRFSVETHRTTVAFTLGSGEELDLGRISL